MPRVRTFALEDARSGARFPLDGSRGVYFSAPEGLGFELDPTMADLRFGFFTPIDEEAEPQGELVGRLEILPPAYETYRSLVDWMARVPSGQLRFVYSPVPAVEVFKLVLPASISKGELDKTRLLLCPCTFRALTPWNRPVPTELILDADDPDAVNARYDYAYTDDLAYGQDAAGLMTARIKAAGHMPGAVLLRYTGAIVSPLVRLTGADSGRVYGLLDLSAASLGASETLELSTLREDSHVVKIAPGGAETDLLPLVDLSHDPYFHLPADEDSILTIESPQPFAGKAELLAYAFYRTV